MDEKVFECKGTVHQLNPVTQEWNVLQGGEVADLLILSSASVPSKTQQTQKAYILVAFSPRTNSPFFKIGLGDNIQYSPNDGDITLNILRVRTGGNEQFAFRISSSRDHAEQFSYYLQIFINGILTYRQSNLHQSNRNMMLQDIAPGRLPFDDLPTLNAPVNNRMYRMQNQSTIPRQYQNYGQMPRPKYGRNYHGDRVPLYHDYKEIEPETIPVQEHIYETLDDEIPSPQSPPAPAPYKSTTFDGVRAQNQNLPPEKPFVGRTQNVTSDDYSKTRVLQQQAQVSNRQSEEKEKSMAEQSPPPNPHIVYSTVKRPSSSDNQMPKAERTHPVMKKHQASNSSWDIMCNMLAEAIDLGNAEKAKEFAAELANQKVKLTIQMLCSDEEKQLTDSTINITVQVEDKQTEKPTIVKLDVNPACTTIGKLKHMVLQLYKFPIDVQRWVIGRRMPRDNETLQKLDVKTTGTVIFLYLLSAKEAGLKDEATLKSALPSLPKRDYPTNGHSQNLYNEPFYSVPVANPMNPAAPSGFQAGHSSLNPHALNWNQSLMNQFPHPPSQNIPSTALNQPNAMPNVAASQGDLAKPPVPPRKQGWTCDQCTYVNIPTRPGCEMCGLDRPADYIPPANLQIDDKERIRLVQEKELERLALESERARTEAENFAALRNFQNTIQAAEMNLIPNPEPFECSICFEDIDVEEGAMLRECLHMFCKNCLTEHIKACEDPEILCPYNDGEVSCSEVITTQEISALLPEEDFMKYLQISLNTAENRADNSFHCKTPNCQGWCIYEDAVNWFFCQLCEKRNCLTCKAIHDNMTCQAYQDDIKRRSQNDGDARKTQQMLDDMVQRGDAMHCPKCQVILQKKDGCDWLRCSMCRTEICWVTRGRRWGPAGHGDTSGGCKCRINGKPCHPKCGNCH